VLKLSKIQNKLTPVKPYEAATNEA